ncbi:class I SAM-dependent methyltransferase [Tsukamurella ocularis]|uniref:class I SAM-dependent methyltransferase n=1 Tax=Tsukamurella ocularis TaxID=1970234 RepID=UPI00216A98CE|nr:class I SAM-dependent methyltransferase [Tsukamurella ocularis]MCS3778675.1 ubiquinone/menaquinone biosynthesis C-methylase UbiE [Tsukamurella ocularis]MCS3789376.1 ubiquinone/menaquinone biosynthesis C-methylase UbiE [Tsukamurella ocularis]MCS3851358.1 ubiquinone/menaquinone biosynthesis C-methylase UbiE [Tsukamurella ocularis]
MTTNHPGPEHDYIPAAGTDRRLPFYDLMSRAFRVGRTHRALVAQAELRPGLDVLEIGCGTGNLLRAAIRAEPGIAAVGVDPDPLALERARRRVRGARIDLGYAQRLAYEDGTFDRVFSAYMFHHLDADVQRETAAEVRRVLRPGGTIHLVDVVGHRHARSAPQATFAADEHAVPAVLREAGIDVEVVGSATIAMVGPVVYYRGR